MPVVGAVHCIKRGDRRSAFPVVVHWARELIRSLNNRTDARRVSRRAARRITPARRAFCGKVQAPGRRHPAHLIGAQTVATCGKLRTGARRLCTRRAARRTNPSPAGARRIQGRVEAAIPPMTGPGFVWGLSCARLLGRCPAFVGWPGPAPAGLFFCSAPAGAEAAAPRARQVVNQFLTRRATRLPVFRRDWHE